MSETSASAGRAPDPTLGRPDLDLALLEERARGRVGEMAYAYFAGGADEERLLRDNVAAWRRVRLLPRVLVDVASVSTATSVLGAPVASPVLVAPTALHRLADPAGEAATARGAGDAGCAMVLSSLATMALEEVAEAAPEATRWMQVYVLKDRGATAELVRRAAASGYQALVVTVDAPVAGLRRREIRGEVHLPPDLRVPNLPDPTTGRDGDANFWAAVTAQFDPGLTFDDLAWLGQTAGLPVAVKGVLRADDAARCVEAGAAAVVVSNHGARQLDDAPATADVLRSVVEAVDGGAEVYVDGGIRRPADVLKALALGARGVLLGRPVLWALAEGGHQGVTVLLEWFRSELARTMALCGCPSVEHLDPSLVAPAC